jgi:hypothetical protein
MIAHQLYGIQWEYMGFNAKRWRFALQRFILGKIGLGKM